MKMSQEVSLRVRIDHIDYVLAAPGQLDRSVAPRVPIIRVYGRSSIGKHACINIHDVFPYFFVNYPESLDPPHVNRYVSKLTHSLNHAISISLKRNPASRKSRFVRAVVLVKGIPFYGFHSSYSPFLKIFLNNPSHVTRATAILQSGSVMRTEFKTFENHLSFPLQFLCDFDLYGCGWVDFCKILERTAKDSISHGLADYDSMPSQFMASPYFRQTRMELEGDAAAHQILNRRHLLARNIHHELKIPGPPLPKEPLISSVRELWDDERQRRVAKGLSPSPEMPIDPSERSRGQGGHWVAETRWWEGIMRKIEKERNQNVPPLQKKSWERWVMTTFESVEALWQDEWKTWRPSGLKTHSQEKNPFSSPESLTDVDSEGDSGEYELEIDEKLLSQHLSRLDDEETQRAQALQRNTVVHQHNIADVLAADEIDDGELKEADFEPQSHSDISPSNGSKCSSTSEERCFSQESKMYTKTQEGFESLKDSPKKRRNPFGAAWKQAVGTDGHTDYALQLERSPRSKSPGPSYHTAMQRDVSSATSLQTRPLSTTTLSSHVDHTDEDSVLLHGASQQRLASRPSPDGAAKPRFDVPCLLREEEQINESRPVKRTKLDNSTHFSIPTGNASSGFVRDATQATHLFTFSPLPPSSAVLTAVLNDYGVTSKIYRDPYYSLIEDAPERPREYAGLIYHLKGGDGLDTLQPWKSDEPIEIDVMNRIPSDAALAIGGWEFASNPPSFKQVKHWLKSEEGQVLVGQTTKRTQSQIKGSTQHVPYGLEDAQQTDFNSAQREETNLSLLSLEMLAFGKDGLVPDPDNNEIVAIFYSFQGPYDVPSETNHSLSYERRIYATKSEKVDPRRLRDVALEVFDGELDLINAIVDRTNELDPDILTGWELQASSWGYLAARGRTYGLDIEELISRAPGRKDMNSSEQWDAEQTSTFKVVGRHVLNCWRIMRASQTLNSYSLENVAFNVLQRRVPRYKSQTLCSWYTSRIPSETSRVLHHYLDRSSTTLDLINQTEVITQTAEFARVFGVDFFSVLTRGSQFKVESFMFRIAKPESFLLISPSKHDVGKQNAAECIPLILEPLSAFYSSPLVVLDFQSLYPSIMIAYNYCYSTCLGRIQDFKGVNKFGVTELHHSPGLLETLKEYLFAAPNGMIYVKPEVRRGLLGRMLTELLDTRIMVKHAMKKAKDDKALTRILEARQLSLKYICNVTYGYTSASFSGRMPAVEVADSIVQSGRETLEKAIRVIELTTKWGAKVVYGDTDSLFVYLRGKTKDQAFRIGNDIAETITTLNPAPIKLKFEKVYLPCVLIAKKRYVGYKYENPDDDAIFDAKGIETIRRDGVPAQAKMTETCLKILFRSQDLSRVKDYCCRSWTKILEGKASIQDFIFAKEIRMGTYSDKVPPPPGAAVAARRIVLDSNDEPQYGERVPYIIMRGEPYSRLVDRAVPPEELLLDRHKKLDAAYYINRVLIPPLDRIFCLVGADVKAWYDEMPKPVRTDTLELATDAAELDMENLTIDVHFQSNQCLICTEPTTFGLCDSCRRMKDTTIAELQGRRQKAERRLLEAHQICVSCSGCGPGEQIECMSLDCPWLFRRNRAENMLEDLRAVGKLVNVLDMEPYLPPLPSTTTSDESCESDSDIDIHKTELETQ